MQTGERQSMSDRPLISGLMPTPRYPEDDRVAARRRLVEGVRDFLLAEDADLDVATANVRAGALVDVVARQLPRVVSL